jgi:hypothetical protein
MMEKTRKLAAASVLASLTACTSLQPVADTQAFFAKESPRFVVVTTTDQQESEDPLVLNTPRFEDGTISGVAMGEATSVPMSRVKTILATQRDSRKTKTALLIGGAVAGGLGVLIATTGKGKSSNYECNPDETAGRCY